MGGLFSRGERANSASENTTPATAVEIHTKNEPNDQALETGAVRNNYSLPPLSETSELPEIAPQIETNRRPVELNHVEKIDTTERQEPACGDVMEYTTTNTQESPVVVMITTKDEISPVAALPTEKSDKFDESECRVEPVNFPSYGPMGSTEYIPAIGRVEIENDRANIDQLSQPAIVNLDSTQAQSNPSAAEQQLADGTAKEAVPKVSSFPLPSKKPEEHDDIVEGTIQTEFKDDHEEQHLVHLGPNADSRISGSNLTDGLALDFGPDETMNFGSVSSCKHSQDESASGKACPVVTELPSLLDDLRIKANDEPIVLASPFRVAELAEKPEMIDTEESIQPDRILTYHSEPALKMQQENIMDEVPESEVNHYAPEDNSELPKNELQPNCMVDSDDIHNRIVLGTGIEQQDHVNQDEYVVEVSKCPSMLASHELESIEVTAFQPENNLHGQNVDDYVPRISKCFPVIAPAEHQESYDHPAKESETIGNEQVSEIIKCPVTHSSDDSKQLELTGFSRAENEAMADSQLLEDHTPVLCICPPALSFQEFGAHADPEHGNNHQVLIPDEIDTPEVSQSSPEFAADHVNLQDSTHDAADATEFEEHEKVPEISKCPPMNPSLDLKQPELTGLPTAETKATTEDQPIVAPLNSVHEGINDNTNLQTAIEHHNLTSGEYKPEITKCPPMIAPDHADNQKTSNPEIPDTKIDQYVLTTDDYIPQVGNCSPVLAQTDSKHDDIGASAIQTATKQHVSFDDHGVNEDVLATSPFGDIHQETVGDSAKNSPTSFYTANITDDVSAPVTSISLLDDIISNPDD